jgi:hypothetical protein
MISEKQHWWFSGRILACHDIRKIPWSRGKLLPTHRVHIKFNNRPLRKLSIAHNSWGSPATSWDQHSHWSAQGKTTIFPFIYFFLQNKLS